MPRRRVRSLEDSRRSSRVRRIVVALAVAAATIAGSLAVASPASAYTTRVDLGRGVGTPWISLIGDSTLSGVRWTNSYWPLERFNYTFDAESCRRTIAPSCRGREGYAPQTALQTMRRLQGSLGHVVILMTGYNDPGTGFPEAVDAIVAEARRQGLMHVIWLTMRTADVSYVSPTYRSNSYTFRDNNRILLQKAQQYGGYLQIADWATYSAGQRSWVGSDGVHLTPSGAVAVATFVAEMAARVFAGTTITPPPSPADGWITLRRGDRGARVAAAQQALTAMGARLVGGADGIFGIYTERAVAGFQARRGLPINGQIDTATASALGILTGPAVLAATSPWADVAQGARGAIVAVIQKAVMNAGIFLRGGADGVFGAYTRAAVATYQRQRGIAPSGVVDEATAIAMGFYTPPAPPPATVPAPTPPPATDAPTTASPPPPLTETPTTTTTSAPPATTVAPTTAAADTTTTAATTAETTTTTTVAP